MRRHVVRVVEHDSTEELALPAALRLDHVVPVVREVEELPRLAVGDELDEGGRLPPAPLRTTMSLARIRLSEIIPLMVDTR